MPSTPYKVEVFGAALQGGTVYAERQPDGTVRVRGLPIFSEVREDDPGVRDGARLARDRAWLETALFKHQKRLAMGKKPLMALRHVFDDPERVGHYELTHLAEAPINPDEPERWTVFGDKVYEDEAAFERAKDHDFRSIEISPDAPEEFGALALLRDKEPFHKYPNVVEKLGPEARAALEETFSTALVECYRARLGAGGQLWRGHPERFEAAPPAPKTKEGDMPDVKDEKKAPSIEERMEACLAKFEERMMKAFEERLAKSAGLKDEKKPEAAQDAEKKPEEKKPEAAQAAASTGPNGMLPPAVSELRPGESFQVVPSKTPAGVAVPDAFAARVATLEQANLGLRAAVEKMEREKAAVGLVARGKKALADMGVPQVSEAFEVRLHDAAVAGGEKAVESLLADVKLAMGLQARGPEPMGFLGGAFQSQPAAGEHPFETQVKKAVETFGARPEAKQRILEAARQIRGALSEHQIRSFDFVKWCRGEASINPAIMEPLGGFQGGN